MTLKPQNSAKKSVYFYSNILFIDYEEEGLEKIKRKIYDACSKELTMSSDKNSDLYIIHTAGFSEFAKKWLFGPRKAKAIVSLHSDPNPPFFDILWSNIQYFRYFYSSSMDIFPFYNRIFFTVVNQAVSLVPLWMKRFFLNKTEILTVPSKTLLTKFPKAIVIHDGIDTNRFKPLPSKRSTIAVGYVGHPTPNKGLIEVLKAFSKIKDANLTKVAALSYLNKKMISTVHKFDTSTEVLGRQKDIVKLYNDIDIVVLPYRHTSGGVATPLVLLEAMSCGCTVITSDLPSIREIGGDTVLYCKPYDIDSIVSMIHHATKHPELRKKLGQAARKRVVELYNEEKMLKSYMDLYRGELN